MATQDTATTRPEGLGRRILLLGGAGTVGTWYQKHLTEVTDTVTTVDTAPGADLPEDVTNPSGRLRSAVAAADEIALALPEDVADTCLPWLASTARPDVLLVSTCSVQQPLYRTAAACGVVERLRGVNPMFSPTLPSAGRPVVVIVPAAEEDGRPDGPAARDVPGARLRCRLESGGMTVSVMPPGTHDETMSFLQALPHAAVLGFLNAFLSAPVDVATLTALAPPPARTLLALACRILAAPPDIYWDIQRANPAGATRRTELAASLERLDTVVRNDHAEEFRNSLAEAARALGTHAAEGADECHDLFERLQHRRVKAHGVTRRTPKGPDAAADETPDLQYGDR